MDTPLRVLFLASEADPFVKVGGLGDVAGSLPRAIGSLEGQPVDIRLAIPLHGAIRQGNWPLQPVTTLHVPHEAGPIPAEIFQTQLDGLTVYLIGGPPFLPEAPVYSTDWGFDAHKYIFFSLAALELARSLDWQPDILHANDWHTAAAVYSLALRRPADAFYRQTSALISIHNLPYLGLGGGAPLGAFGLPPADSSSLPLWARHLPLPLGLYAADAIVAVSPTYAQEMLTLEFGAGLDEFLKTRVDDITGILNGLDLTLWDPATDSAIAAPFSVTSLSRRDTNKTALQRELGLLPDPATPLLAMIGRMDEQKGIGIGLDALQHLADRHYQFVILGTGQPAIEEKARRLQIGFPDRVRAVLRFDAPLSRRIYAGADALLIPSRYEPCGLAQMIAMRYGCVPIARAVGGLRDTIIESRTGFLFFGDSPEALREAIRRSLAVYADRPRWEDMQRLGMEQDFSWARSARQYVDLYRQLVSRRQATLA